MSTDDTPSRLPEAADAGQKIAVAAEVLYLVNLLLLPIFAFLALVWLFIRHRDTSSALARCHLNQTMAASLWAGILLVIINVLVILAGGWQSVNVWMYVIIYFTIGHSTLILLGIVGLSKALSGTPWKYPIFGWRCDS